MTRSVPGGLSIPLLLIWVAAYSAFAVYLYLQFTFVQRPTPAAAAEVRLIELQKGREEADRRLKQMETELNDLEKTASIKLLKSGKGSKNK